MIPVRLEEPRRINKLAIASLILSATPLLVCLAWLTAAGILCIVFPSFICLEALRSVVALGAARLNGTTTLFYLAALSILASLSGLVAGIVSLAQIKKSHESEAGGRMAITGICFVIPGIILELIFVAYLAFFWFILGIPM